MVSTRLLRSGVIAAFLMLATMTTAQAVTLKVVAARNEPAVTAPAICAPSATQVCKGTTVVSDYKFLVNVDNTGQTITRSPTGVCSPTLPNSTTINPAYPNSCEWTSIAGAASHSPVYTQGDSSNVTAKIANLPNGRYLVSVLADGYKLDGRHFTVAGGTVAWEGKKTTDPADEVLVEMQPWPLPDAQIQAAVFEDVSPVNSGADVPAERGLAGFQGHITDYLGEVTTDVYGNPMCGSGRCLSKCYVVSSGVDIGIVTPDDWSNPNTPSASGFGRCPIITIDETTGTISPAIPMYGLDGITRTGNVPDTASIQGKVELPNLGPNRYALSVTPPDGSGWVQTTTLEGNHDWDAWVMEGSTGLDTEFMIAGEPFPAIIFGYVPVPGTPSAVGTPVNSTMSGTATITGTVEAVKVYVPTTGGIGGMPGDIWGGMQGAKLDKPIVNPWVTLTDLTNGDSIVWAGQGDANGRFSIPNVPAGTYTLTWWDDPQNEILDLVNVTVSDGESIDMGILPLAGWWTFYEGYVFNDTNRNGVMDSGEQGLAGYTLTLRKRENSLMDRGSTVATTDAFGYYKFEAAYPMTQYLVLEAYDDLHYTTGVTFQADNQPDPTTLVGPGVDVSVHPIIGLGGRVDWGKHAYDATGRNGVDPRNGGIVGTVSYDTTRNELDPRYAAVEDWQPSISDLTVNLYLPVPATLPCVRLLADGSNAATASCDASGRYALDASKAIARGPLLNTYVSETWHRPNGCVARGVDGTPLVHGTDEQVLPLDDNKECIEAPLMGVQFFAGSLEANDGVTVDGNYGFGDGCFAPNTLDATDPADPKCISNANPAITDAFTPLPARDYLVQVDLASQPDMATGEPIYKVTREEDINIGNGDDFIPPAVPPSACVGALHTVDSTGNANFPGGPGTSPYENMQKPLCDVKLVTLSNGKSIAPAFNLYTDVPLPSRHWFIIIDDLNFSSNPKSSTFGEKAGMPFVPVGIYDYTDRLVKTVEADYNGLADVLLPSTNRINCPTPSGVCANLYRYVGNDPGVPGRLNLNYDPTFRTIAAEFEALPGLLVPADLAPTQVGVTVQLPGGQTTAPVQCRLDAATPELYAVSVPYVTLNGSTAARTVSIYGKAFVAPYQVLLNGVALPGTAVTPVSASQIDVVVPGTTTSGPKQLSIVVANGQQTVNGLTLHALSGTTSGYNPALYLVGPGRTYAPAETLPATANHAVQLALDAAASFVRASTANSTRGALVVVFPNDTSANPRQNPRGAYYENLIINARVKLQGVGPGSPDGSVRGSIIDGGAFAGDSPVATDWYTTIGAMTWSGNQTIYDGAVISLYLPSDGSGAFPTGSYNANTAPSIDGFDLRGGDQQGFPGNINATGGGPTGQPGGLITQGGAVFANAYANNLQITNNVVQNNGAAYGTIRVGTPDIVGAAGDNNNDNMVIAYNRVIANAGTNQAGGIGLFRGSDNFTVAHNDICGNFSAEYGGGVSVVGLSNATAGNVGRINDNRIYFNRSYDEGGGIMIAGALPANTDTLSPGSGPVDIYNNLIQSNLSNDDGGGLRFLMSGNFPMNVYNNIIANNISTHEGGGVSINDAPNVRVYNNTIMKNITTATAITSDGTPAPAGLSSSLNSALLMACRTGQPNLTQACQGQPPMVSNAPVYSDPVLFNNVFWDNRAGTRTVTNVAGIGNDPLNLATCTTMPGCDHWDLGVADLLTANLTPTNSIVQQVNGTLAGQHAYTPSVTNSGANPNVVSLYDVGVTFNSWRNNPAFLGAIMISADLPPNLQGDYHLQAGSPAVNLGAASKSGVTAPGFDIDNQVRIAAPDSGADERFVAIAIANLAPTSVAFGSVPVGSTSASQTVTLSNTGTAALTGIGVAVTAPFSRPSGAAGGTCATTLNAGANCTIAVVYAPTAAGAAAGTITVTASVPVSGSPVSLTGTGTPALPALGLLDNFNRSNANNLGASWSQSNTGTNVDLRVNGNQVLANQTNDGGQAIWNQVVFGVNQGAATAMSGNNNSSALVLKANGGSTTSPVNFVRVRYQTGNGGQVVVATTTNSGGTYTTRATFNSGTFASGNVLTAKVSSAGLVSVWKTAGTTTTFLGSIQLPTTGTNTWTTGGGRIGIQLQNVNARVDNFAGGNLP
ncbi:MAG: choice-of-anchor D domain-containing protein [Steroidobacteraceae bacterium]